MKIAVKVGIGGIKESPFLFISVSHFSGDVALWLLESPLTFRMGIKTDFGYTGAFFFPQEHTKQLPFLALKNLQIFLELDSHE